MLYVGDGDVGYGPWINIRQFNEDGRKNAKWNEFCQFAFAIAQRKPWVLDQGFVDVFFLTGGDYVDFGEESAYPPILGWEFFCDEHGSSMLGWYCVDCSLLLRETTCDLDLWSVRILVE
jgi:hypothetical protein